MYGFLAAVWPFWFHMIPGIWLGSFLVGWIAAVYIVLYGKP
jgi:hypothetical protein